MFDLLGDTEVVEAAAAGLARRLADVNADAIVTAETKSVPLVLELARTSEALDRAAEAARPSMGETIEPETVSITTGHPQTAPSRREDRELVEGRNVVLVDDVISAGARSTACATSSATPGSHRGRGSGLQVLEDDADHVGESLPSVTCRSFPISQTRP